MRVVITMDPLRCIEPLQFAVSRYGMPEIINSDQGDRFAGREFMADIRMDGCGRYRDNVGNRHERPPTNSGPTDASWERVGKGNGEKRGRNGEKRSILS